MGDNAPVTDMVTVADIVAVMERVEAQGYQPSCQHVVHSRFAGFVLDWDHPTVWSRCAMCFELLGLSPVALEGAQA